MRVLLALLLVTALAGPATTISASEHQWQGGIWRDIQQVTQDGGAISIPVGGLQPYTVNGITVPGAPPTYISIPTAAQTEYVTIDGPAGLRYVAAWRRHFTGVIVNDPIDFAVEGQHLYVRGTKAGQAHKLTIVKIIRLEPR